MIRRNPEPHTLAGAYAMDALDPAGQRRFSRHLARCRECTDEIAELREVAGRLALASATRPPEPLKEQILAVTERTRQLPPVIGRAAHRRYGPAKARTGRLARTPRLALALAAATVMAVAAIWLAVRPGQQSPARTPVGEQAITAVLTAPDAVMIDAPVRRGGTATVVMSMRERRLVFAAAGLHALPASRCYELWLVHHGRDRPAGLLPMPKHGMTGPVIASGLRRGDRLALSVEPATGSDRPTSPMILVLAL
jgi:anti-sigma-K factor RskA